MKKGVSRRKAGVGEQGDLFGPMGGAPSEAGAQGPGGQGPEEQVPRAGAPVGAPPEVPREAPADVPPTALESAPASEPPAEGGGRQELVARISVEEEGDVGKVRMRPETGTLPPARPRGALTEGEELFLPGRAGLVAGRALEGEPPLARPVRVPVSVGELTRSIKGTLEGAFPRVLVKGEVSGFRGVHPRGHIFFSLKDAEASIEVKMWASVASRMKFQLRDGMAVVAEGSVDVYAPQGRYSLVVHRLEPDGEGALALAFQQLKERLAAEGLFGPLRTRAPRPLPFPPRRIGVVTSRSGAALQDFLRVLHARHPRLSVLVCDARVQGEGAAEDVVRALQRLARTDVDVIVVTRGGGSVEDLWTFNEERVARAIFASPVPVVSAIGHEVDFTIADFVADVRAPTPSAAAELLAPVLAELEAGLKTAEVRLRKAAERAVLEARGQLAEARLGLPDPQRLLSQGRLHLAALGERLARAAQAPLKASRERQRGLAERLHRQQPQAQLARARAELAPLAERLQRALRERLRAEASRVAQARLALERVSPATRVGVGRERLAALSAQLLAAQRRRVEGERARLGALAGRLEAMSPLRVMARGYSVTFRQADGSVVRHVREVHVGETVTIRLAGVECREPGDCEELDAQVVAVRPRPDPRGE